MLTLALLLTLASADSEKLKVSRIQAKFYRLSAERLATVARLERIEAELAKVQAEYERLVKAAPGYREGCEYDEETQDLKCKPADPAEKK